MLKAPKLINYKEMRVEIKKLFGESKILFDEIFEMLDKIEVDDKERVISLWISAPRGSIKDYEFETDDDAMFYFDVETPEEIEPTFLVLYPKEKYWFKIDIAHNDECRYIRFDKFEVLIMNDGDEQNNLGVISEESILKFIKWLHGVIQEKIQEIAKGIYGKNIEKNLPYEHRFGIISHKDYWRFVPEDREYVIGKLSTEEIDKFVNLYEKEGDNYIPTGRIKDMNFNKYFEMAICGYEAMGLALKGETLKDKFERYGEDFGGGILEELDMESTKDFDYFFTDKPSMGGHPWGIMKGSSRTRMMLSPRLDDNGYYFVLGGDEIWICDEIVKMYLAMKEHNFPVKLSSFKNKVEYLQEKGYIGIVPRDRIALYCQLCFPDRNIEDFRHWDEEIDGLFEAIEWLPLKDYKLK